MWNSVFPFSSKPLWMGYYFEEKDMLRCIEALEADGSLTVTGSSGQWESCWRRNKLGKKALSWMTNLCVLRMNARCRSCGTVLSEKKDKSLSIACFGETPSSLGLGSWVKAKDWSLAGSRCVGPWKGVCQVLGWHLFYNAFPLPGLQVRSGRI